MTDPELAHLDKKMTEAEEKFTKEMVLYYSKALFSNTFHSGLSALVQGGGNQPDGAGLP